MRKTEIAKPHREYFLSKDPLKGTFVILVHAMFRDCTYFKKPPKNSLVDFLNFAGLNVLAVNLSGTTGSKIPERNINIDTYVQDIRDSIEQVRLNYPNSSIYLLGHSMGGLVCLFAAGKVRVNGVIAVAPSIWTFHSEKKGLIDLQHSAKALFAKIISNIFGYLPAKVLRLGEKNAPKGYNDQYWQWIHSRKVSSADRSEDYIKTLSQIECPVLFIWGAKDTHWAPIKNLEWLKNLSGQKCEILRVENGNEFNFAADHFSVIYGSVAATHLWPKYLEWIKQHCGVNI